jgi:hypothetical protein
MTRVPPGANISNLRKLGGDPSIISPKVQADTTKTSTSKKVRPFIAAKRYPEYDQQGLSKKIEIYFLDSPVWEKVAGFCPKVGRSFQFGPQNRSLVGDLIGADFFLDSPEKYF